VLLSLLRRAPDRGHARVSLGVARHGRPLHVRRGAAQKRPRAPQLLEIPELVRPLTRGWWERAGGPAAGLLFAARRGEHVGSGPRLPCSNETITTHAVVPLQ